MKELINASFSLINVIPTALLVFVAGYWLVVFAGLLDMEAIDINVDADVDVDLDTDIETDADAAANSDSTGISDSISWFNHVLIFFNLHHLPLMVFLSFLALPMWALSILANVYLGNETFLFSLVLLVPNFLVSLMIAKVTTLPVAKIFKKLDANTESTNPIGKICTVQLPVKPGRIGQAIINDLNGNTVRINVIGTDNTEIAKDETAFVIKYVDKDKSYLVEPYDK